MFMHANLDPARWQQQPGETLLEYWTSLSPMAPMFGTPWRFADSTYLRGAAVAKSPRASVDPSHADTPEPHTATVDDLTQIKGIGPKLSQKLMDAGVTRFAQIAGWSARDIDGFEAAFGEVPGRIARDKWVEQAAGFVTGTASQAT